MVVMGDGAQGNSNSMPKRVTQPPFDYTLDFDALDFRAQPQLYRIGRGEQGVLLVEPYKSELLPHWRFRTPEIARESSAKLWEMFEKYRAEGDFVGMDMARKFLQMGHTRARRYANHRSGRKWAPGRTEVLPREIDPVKVEAAAIFHEVWIRARTDPEYLRLKAIHLARYPGPDAADDQPERR